METDLFKKKMEIAQRAGVLNAEINQLSKLAASITEAKTKNMSREGVKPEAIYVEVQIGSTKKELRSYELDKDGVELHDAILMFLDSQIDKRKKELDELIKVLQ